MRAELLSLLGVSGTYQLDRLDAQVTTTLDMPTQTAVRRVLQDLRDPNGLGGTLREPRLLARGDPSKVVYSFSLYEREGDVNVLRAQVDTLDQPFNVNRGMKLDLGSTAKLRTLVQYLEIVSRLWERWHTLPTSWLRYVDLHRSDAIGAFVREQLVARPKIGLDELLAAALERRFSASPGTLFFTGGGLHRFANFDEADDVRVMTLRAAFRHSVNLPFVRLMREIVDHTLFGVDGIAGSVLDDPNDPARAAYLERFIAWEGRLLLDRFLAKHGPLSARAAQPRAVRGPARDAAQAHGGAALARPGGGPLRAPRGADDGAARDDRPESLRGSDDRALRGLPAGGPLVRRPRLADGHPPDRALAGRLPERASRRDPQRGGRRERAGAARILPVAAQVEAARRAGPADPDPARAGGLRADPRGLAPARLSVRVAGAFATRRRSAPPPTGPTRWPSCSASCRTTDSASPPTASRSCASPRGPRSRPCSARAASSPSGCCAARSRARCRSALLDVVESGSAVRARGAFTLPDGTPVAVGGKTGTGDNRIETFGPGVRLESSKVTSRSATFAFLIGDRHFGVITAYVEGEGAAEFGFTSSLPVQVLKQLAPSLAGLLQERREVATAPLPRRS